MSGSAIAKSTNAEWESNNGASGSYIYTPKQKRVSPYVAIAHAHQRKADVDC